MKNEFIYKKLLEIEKLFRLNNDLILDINGATEFLKTKKSYLYHLTSKFEIPYYKLGKKLLFSKLDLMEWLQKKRIKTLLELENERNKFYNNRFPWLRSNS